MILYRSHLSLLCLIAGTFFVHPAWSATATTTFLVTATVANECIVAAANLNFGVYSVVAATPTDATSTIGITCTNLTPYTISLNGGGEASISARKMSGTATPSVKLAYQLYMDSTRATILGDGTTGSIVSGTGNGLIQNFTVYGRIPAAQAVGSDAYTDTITITVTY